MGESAAIAGGGALLGGLMGSQNSGGQTQTSSGSSTPWSVQQPYMQQGFQDAQNLYNQQGSSPVSQFDAGLNGVQQAAIGGLENGYNNYRSAYTPVQNEAQDLQYFSPNYGATAYGISANGIGAQSPSTGVLANYAQTGQLPNGESSIDTGLQNGINSASMNSLGSLASGSSLASQAGSQALNTAGNLGTIQSEANAFASNPTLQSEIQSQQAQVQNSLGTQALPAIESASTQTGNVNSSRTGALEGQAITGADLADSNIASQLTANAYNTGASTASSQITNGLNAANYAASDLNNNGSIGGSLGINSLGQQINQQQFGVNSQLGAANEAASQDLGYQTANTNAQLSGNQQIGTGLQIGNNATTQFVNGDTGLLNTALGAATTEQGGQQTADNNQVALAQQPWNQLQNYWNIEGKPLGTQTQQTATTTPNNGGLNGAISGAVGLGTAAYGMTQGNGALGGLFGSATSSNPFAGAGTGYFG